MRDPDQPTVAAEQRQTARSKSLIGRRTFLKIAAGGAASAFAVGFYTWRLEPVWEEVVQLQLPVRDLPQNLEGLRAVQLSDLHIGPRVDDAYLIKCFERVKGLEPDVVFYTGDFTSYSPDVVEHASRMFPRLPHGRRATIGILGNHDYGPNWAHPEIAAQLVTVAESSGIRMLRNSLAQIDGLQVLGLDDLWAHRFDLQKGLGLLDLSRAAIVLSHNPDTADEMGWDSYKGWILSGHTHGGQCKPPFLPPPLLPVKNRRYTAGEFELTGGRRLYINRGLGHLIRVRFNVRPEITLFTLTPA